MSAQRFTPEFKEEADMQGTESGYLVSCDTDLCNNAGQCTTMKSCSTS